MLGLENFHVFATDRFATELSEVIPVSVRLLFLRLYPRVPRELLEILKIKLRSRGCSMWVFVDVSDSLWECPDVDIFSSSFERALWNDPAQLAQSLRWQEVQRRRQHAVSWTLPGLMYTII